MHRDNFADDPSGVTARSEQFPAPWAKRAPDGSWHSVVAHSLDVGVVARRLMGRPVLRARMSAAFGIELTDVHLNRLAVLAGLHDAGKCLSGFQAKPIHISGIGQGHVTEFLAALTASEGVRKAVDLEVLAGWFEQVEDALMASICHHGQPADRSSIDRRLSEVEEQLSVTVHGHDPVSELRRLSGGDVGGISRIAKNRRSSLFPADDPASVRWCRDDRGLDGVEFDPLPLS